jgi:DNA-binding CsgD family transcriptional regulator
MATGLVGRDAPLATLLRSVRQGAGAVVVSDAGDGRTRLAREVVDRCGVAVRWVAVTTDAHREPYWLAGALVPLDDVPDAAAGTAGRIATETEAFHSVRRFLRAGSDDATARPLLVIDDAHLLDRGSAALLHRVATAGDATVLATVLSGAQVSAGITALWKDAGCDRVDIGPLDRADTGRLCRALLGGEVDRWTRYRIWRLTLGNPREVRELISSSVETGGLAVRDGLWSMSAALVPSRRLADMVHTSLGALPEPARRVAEVLAVAGRVDRTLLGAAVDEADLLALEQVGMARPTGDDRHPAAVELARPLHTEVLRATLPVASRMAAARRLLAAACVNDSPVDRLTLLLWEREAGHAGAATLAAAARLAYRRMEYGLAAAMGRESLARVDDPQIRTLVGSALGEEGRTVEAARELERVVTAGIGPEVRLPAVAALARVRFAAGDQLSAMELLEQELRNDHRPGPARDELLTTRSILRTLHGALTDPPEVADPPPVTGPPVVAGPPEGAHGRLVALVGSTLADAVGLRADAVDPAVAEGLAQLAHLPSPPPYIEDLLYANLHTADVVRGELAAARQRLVGRRQAALAAEQADVLGLWLFLDAQLTMWEGRPGPGYDLMREALRLIECRDPASLLALAHVEAAHAAISAGREETAVTHLDLVPSVARSTPRVGPRMAHMRALLAAAHSGVARAAADALAAGAWAADHDVLLWAVEAWHVAVRLGAPAAAAPLLAQAAADTPGRYVSLLAAHAEAARAADAAALEAVAAGFHQAGFGLLAAEAAAQAVALHRRRGRSERARRASALARGYLAPDAYAVTPALAALASGPRLTPREREIAQLVARGLTSRQVADRLHLSPRTVDNRLASIYDKLGISGRGELAEVLPAGLSDRPE